ncbi:hypothetical protein [Falsarthrobacter nasiphocae]|uniref:O-antigen/teichoic acid export membrane protein n=1 Tax=Falsarthrobacter nasiphocae TaxID=189863 RepID=A0AAE4C6E3_9MICC|nr:hypothetical protein [Falsarthrobacter nasiphocae]MDR6891399.1 O-antigen/teichoic acid export membrane protein [Falsarthrobacter nasiphocae]
MNLAKRAPLLYLIGAAVQGLAAVFVQPFSIALFGGPRSHGWETTAFAVSMMQIGLVVLSAGLPLAITRAWLEPDGGPAKARAINGFNGLFALAVAAVACAIGAAAGLEPSILAAIWSMGALAVVLAAQAQLRAETKPLHFVALAGGSSLVAHAAGLVSIVITGPSAAHYMVGFAIASTATALAAVALTRPSLPTREMGAVRIAVVAGLPLLPHSLAMILLSQGDVMLLKALAPPGESGVYLAASVFALGPIAVLAGLNNAWSPAIMKSVHEGQDAFEATVRGTLDRASLLAAGMAVAGSVLSWLGVLIIAGGSPDVTRVAAVLPLVGIGYAVYLVMMSVLFARLATRSFAWLTASVVVVAGLLAVWPSSHGDLVLVAYVKVLAFALLGAGYALMARGRARFSLARPALFLAAAVVVSLAVLGVLHVMGT